MLRIFLGFENKKTLKEGRNGMLKPWQSFITEIDRDKLITRGVDQEEILRTYRYEEMIYLLVLGKRPAEVESEMLRAVIISHCSHGITGQSTLAVRMGVDCGPAL